MSFLIRKSKDKRVKLGARSVIVTLLISVSFIVAGFFAINDLRVDSNMVLVNGEVVDIIVHNSRDGITYAPIVEFTADNKDYRAVANHRSSNRPSIGSIREIAYDPDNPNDSVVVGSFWVKLMAWLFPLIGVLVTVAVFVALIKSQRRNKDIKSLISNGVKLEGILTDIKRIDSSNRGDTLYKVVVSAVDSENNTKQYVSDNISSIGGLIGMDLSQTPIPIDVYIDRSNPDRYYVDLSDIPNLDANRIKELIKQAKTQV